MDLHFKCMLNVMSKLELIETGRNVEVHSGLTGADVGLAHLEPCRQMEGPGEQGAQPCPICSLAEPWPGQFSSLSPGFLICKGKEFKPNEPYNFSLLRNHQVLPWEPLSPLCFAICKSAEFGNRTKLTGAI